MYYITMATLDKVTRLFVDAELEPDTQTAKALRRQAVRVLRRERKRIGRPTVESRMPRGAGKRVLDATPVLKTVPLPAPPREGRSCLAL
jgi:hypothetical protein